MCSSLNQINAEMVKIGDSWAKVITTTEDSQEFIDDVIKRLGEE